jgi:pimeloyl-[acyl-carrier protein] methyl ester esterase
VWLHGWSAESSVLRPFADVPGRQALFVDLPGHGDSPWEPGLTLASLADAVLDLAPPRADYAGWSLGGILALACAAAQPARVRSVALLSAPNFGGDRARRMRELVRLDRNRALAEFYRAVYSDAEKRLPGFHELQQELAKKRRLPPSEAILGIYDAFEAGLPTLDLTRVTCRVLILHGAADAISPLARARDIAGRIPNASLEELPDAGHAPFLTFPDTCRAAIERFWSALV